MSKIETVEQAIAAIESAGFTLKNLFSSPTDHEIRIYHWRSKKEVYDFRIREDVTPSGYLDSDQELIKFARFCNLKVFW